MQGGGVVNPENPDIEVCWRSCFLDHCFRQCRGFLVGCPTAGSKKEQAAAGHFGRVLFGQHSNGGKFPSFFVPRGLVFRRL